VQGEEDCPNCRYSCHKQPAFLPTVTHGERSVSAAPRRRALKCRQSGLAGSAACGCWPPLPRWCFIALFPGIPTGFHHLAQGCTGSAGATLGQGANNPTTLKGLPIPVPPDKSALTPPSPCQRRGQRPGPAAPGVRLVSEPSGWPRFAEPSGSRS
jgi:hypothetical protein